MVPAFTALWSNVDSGGLSPKLFLQARLDVFLRPRLLFPACLLCFPFLFALLLSWTYRSLQRHSQRNHSAYIHLTHKDFNPYLIL